MPAYDFLIVGAGLFGAVCARELTDQGKRVLVIEKRDHIAGNCYDETVDGIRMNRYGGHIFHTRSRRIWEYASRFTAWRQYEHRVKVSHKNRVYSFPVNLMTLHQIYGITTVGEARELMEQPKVTKHLFDTFFDGYTRKQWGMDPADVPGGVLDRIPYRLTWDDRYFDDDYQGLPVDGYTAWIGRMLDGIPVYTQAEYLLDREAWDREAKQTIYSGPLDTLYRFDRGRLEYRSLSFETMKIDREYYQGCATMNYTGIETPWTRIMEWKCFNPVNVPHTLITREYPRPHDAGREPYYPVRTKMNVKRYQEYRERAESEGLIVGGRLGSFQYLNMDQVIGQALATAEKLTNGENRTS
jgi:UDP-galactopyranose mutase